MSDQPTPARVRFAPSPTGLLHLGSLRTALFNWLYARHTDGQFVFRIEDTDQKRYDAASLENFKQGLLWLGLQWDEGPDIGGAYGPYVQTQRRELYAQHVEQLLATDHAYRCYASAEELAQMRAEQQAHGGSTGYDRRHRNLTDAERAAFEAEGRTPVIRFKAPLSGMTVIHDLVRGDIEVENQSVRDPVIFKSDGLPTYHLAVVVDDHLMEISHVVRGDEWISSTSLHAMLYDAFGWEAPDFVHLPLILDPSGKGKMSKRKTMIDGTEFSPMVNDYIDGGYLPEAMFNFLTNVGWSFDAEREIFSREEAIARFSLGDINPAAAALPFSKLEWLNGVYIRDLEPAELKERLIPFLSRDLGIDAETLRASQKLTQLIPLIQERLKTLTDAADRVDWAFQTADEISYADPAKLIGKKLDAPQSLAILESGIELLSAADPFDASTLEGLFRAAAIAAEQKAGSFFGPFRVAVTGKTVSPPLFESMAILGRDEVVARVKNAIGALRAYAAEVA